MKTKTNLILLISLIFPFLSKGQVIDGPGNVCLDGAPITFSVVDYFGDPINFNGFLWDDGAGSTFEGSNLAYTFNAPGVYTITLLSPDGTIEDEHEVNVWLPSTDDIEVIPLSASLCLGGSTNNCEQVCENSTVTYTTSVNNPGTDLQWTVLGAENWTSNGNEVTVEWGSAGQGQVNVEMGGADNSLMTVYCAIINNFVWQGGNSVFALYAEGPSPAPYFVEVDGIPNDYFGPGDPLYIEVPAGDRTISIFDTYGNSQTCEVTVEATPPFCELYAEVAFNKGSCDQNCDGSIELTSINGGTAPYSYQWSTGSSTKDLSGLCEGLYSVTIVDADGCERVLSDIPIRCPEFSCPMEGNLCVDILENPEAAFTTNPPLENGLVEICEGQTVFFENQTNGAFSYTWDFGNSVSSAQVNASHTYLSAGTYDAFLIARNDCFCGDTAMVTIVVEPAISPEISCAGTICPKTQVSYSSDADCGTFLWNVSANGTIVDGGGTSDDFITVDWGAGPEGLIELAVDNCTGNFCTETLFETIPIVDDNAVIQGPRQVCKGTEVLYSLPAFAGTEFNWAVSNFGTITGGQGTNEISVQWIDATVAAAQEVSVSYESCYLGCGGSATLSIKILDEVFVEGPVLVCPNEMTNYSSQTPGGTFVPANWSLLDPTGTIVASSPSATTNYSIDWTYGSGTYILSATIQDPSSYCVSDFSIFIDVSNPTANPTAIDGPIAICPTISHTYSAVSAGDFDYSWSVTDGANVYTLHGEMVNITWGTTPPFRLELKQANLIGFSCISEAIMIAPQAINAIDIIGNTAVCAEGIGMYTATDYEDIVYDWEIIPSGAGSIIEGASTNQISVQWHEAGNFDLRVSACGNSNMLPVIVNARPEPTPLAMNTCPNVTVPVALANTYAAYQWRDEDVSLISTNAVADLPTGYYEVIVTDNNGCTENETFYIGSLGAPEVRISTPDFGDFCENGGSMTLFALESNAGTLDYQWFRNNIPFGMNSSEQVINQEGTYYVEVTDANGCSSISNTLSLDCIILPPSSNCMPDGVLDFEMAPGSFCNESQYINTSVNDIPNTWSWSFRDIGTGMMTSSNLENPTHTWTSAGFNLVIFQASIPDLDPNAPDCPVSLIKFDTVPVVANFTHEGICSGTPVSFTDLSSFIPQTNIVAWQWDFGDPASGPFNTSTDQNPTHVFGALENYVVTLTITDASACTSVSQQTIQISDPDADTFIIPTRGCQGEVMTFQAMGTYTDISWNFGDPSSGAANTATTNEAYHIFESPGFYNVSYSVENIYGCTDFRSVLVQIEANDLSGAIAFSPATEVCAGDSVLLTAPIATTYRWSTGATIPAITVDESGTYAVTIYDADGCAFTPSSLTIDVLAAPQAQIASVEYNEYDQPINYFYNNVETCFGEDVFLEISENLNYTYEWSTGENTMELSFTEEKDNLLPVGTYTFTNTITNLTTGCTNLIGPFTVTVHPVPEDVLITSSPSAPVCENTLTTFSIVNPNPNYTYIWNTGEIGTTMTTFYAGAYFARATNQFACESQSNLLEIIPGPNIDLIPSGCHSRCNPDTICLPAISGVVNFQWYYEGLPINPPEGNDPDYIATQSGEYHVEMLSADGCLTISDPLTLELFDGFGSVAGTVYFDLNNNGVIDGADTLMTGIDIILQNGGVNLDTLRSDANGAILFSNILASDYILNVDELNLPVGTTAIIAQAAVLLEGCEAEAAANFLIQFTCSPTTESLNLGACPGDSIEYEGVFLNIGDTQTFDLISGQGCDSTVTVIVGALPISTNSLDTLICEGETFFYNGENLSPETSTDFTFSNSLGCDSIVTVNVGTALETQIEVELFVCEGNTVFYNGLELEAGYEGVLMLNNPNGCDTLANVQVMAASTIDFEIITQDACWNTANGFISIENITGGTPPFQYSLDGVTYQDSTIFLGLNGGEYTVYVIDDENCEMEQSINLEVTEALTIDADVPEIACDLSPVFLQLKNVPVASDTVSFLWNDGSVESFIAVDTPGIYTVQITNACETIVQEYTVPIARDTRREFFFAPNVFSPNGDGINDRWRIQYPASIEVVTFELQLFNRWGSPIRQFNTIDDFWEGDFKGSDIGEGVYVWWYRATIRSCGRTLEIFDQGDVTLVR